MGRQLDRLVPLQIRAAALMPAAVLSVHQLRFQLAFGAGASGKLAAEGHQYLSSFLVPLAAMALAIGVGLFLARLAQAWQQGTDRREERGPAAPFLGVWAIVAVSLLAIYCGQELLEGFLAVGHPGGLAGALGEGGLWAVPLAALFGAVVALCLRVADAAIGWASGRRGSAPARRSLLRRTPRPAAVFLALREPLADSAAGRAPPRLVPLTF